METQKIKTKKNAVVFMSAMSVQGLTLQRGADRAAQHRRVRRKVYFLFIVVLFCRECLVALYSSTTRIDGHFL